MMLGEFGGEFLVDLPFQWLAGEIPAEFFDHVMAHAPALVVLRAGNVRGEDDVGQGVERRLRFGRFGIGHIEHRLNVGPAGEDLNHFGFADHGAASVSYCRLALLPELMARHVMP